MKMLIEFCIESSKKYFGFFLSKIKFCDIEHVTDAGQSTHFHILFRGAEEMKLMNSSKTLVKHLPFGVVLGKDKKKFKKSWLKNIKN